MGWKGDKMSRVNGKLEVNRGRMVWGAYRDTSVEHAAEVWWSGGRNVCTKLELAQNESG